MFDVVEFDLVGLNSVWFGVVKFGLVHYFLFGWNTTCIKNTIFGRMNDRESSGSVIPLSLRTCSFFL